MAGLLVATALKNAINRPHVHRQIDNTNAEMMTTNAANGKLTKRICVCFIAVTPAIQVRFPDALIAVREWLFIMCRRNVIYIIA